MLPTSPILDPKNANKGTARGDGMLERSLQQYGAGRYSGRNLDYIIYALVDPRTDEIRYIGKTDDAYHRFRSHIHDAIMRVRQSHCQTWIRSLHAVGVKPVMYTIEVVTEETWAERERYWIATYRRHGTRLTNHADGGQDGSKGYRFNLSEEAKRKISSARIGMKFTEEHKQRLRDHKNQLWQTERGMQIRNTYSRQYAKLTDDQVIEIWRLATTRAMTQRVIADTFGIPSSTVSEIKNNKRYKHVPRPTHGDVV